VTGESVRKPVLKDLGGDVDGDRLGSSAEFPGNRLEPALLLRILLLLGSLGDVTASRYLNIQRLNYLWTIRHSYGSCRS
jgi:hypothetical protein